MGDGKNFLYGERVNFGSMHNRELIFGTRHRIFVVEPLAAPAAPNWQFTLLNSLFLSPGFLDLVIHKSLVKYKKNNKIN